MKYKYFFINLFLILTLSLLSCSRNCLTPYINDNNKILFFKAEKNINDVGRLSVDIIVVNNSEEILNIGPDEWFVNSKRKNLVTGEQIYFISINSNENVSKKIKIKENTKRIILFAEYGNTSERKNKQIVLYPDEFKNNIIILLKKNKMIKYKSEI